MTIVERKTSFTVTKRVFDKSVQTVTAATIALLEPFKDAVLTITANNGKEFAYHKQLTQALECDVFFADSYCAWQRGLNDNTNGLLRQYWPKSTVFKKVSDLEVDDVPVKLNSRSRKKLTFKTLFELMDKHIAALAA